MKKFGKHIIFIFLLVMIVTSIVAQCTTKKDSVLHKKVYTKVEVMPEFPGGMDGWRRYLEKSFQISDDFGEDSCGLRLNYRYSMIVEPNGFLSNIKINNKCDTTKFCAGEKALFHILKKGPRWKPGKFKSNAVAVKVDNGINIEVQ